MGEAALPTNLTWSILGNLLRVVVMLFGNTMINSRVDFHGWKSTLTIGYLLRGESQMHV
jgi:hypothetical protein